MRTTIAEAAKLSSLLDHINEAYEAYAAEAEVVYDEDHRWHQITIDQGGKTIFAAAVSIDNEAAEAQYRLIRHEVEALIDECSLPILHLEVAA